MTTATLNSWHIPRTGRLDIDIKVTTEVNISAMAARQKVSRFVLSEISNLMHGSEPDLIVSDRVHWRVPVILSFPSRGDVGTVGAIDVDIETGQLLITPQLIAEITANAEKLTASPALSTN